MHKLCVPGLSSGGRGLGTRLSFATLCKLCAIVESVRGGYSQANSRNNLWVHRTSSNYCNVSVPEDLLQAYSTRHSVQNKQMHVLTVVLKYKTGRLKLEKSIVTGVHRSGVRCDGVHHGGVCHDIIHPDWVSVETAFWGWRSNSFLFPFSIVCCSCESSLSPSLPDLPWCGPVGRSGPWLAFLSSSSWCRSGVHSSWRAGHSPSLQHTAEDTSSML